MLSDEELEEIAGSLSETTKNEMLDISDPHLVFSVDQDGTRLEFLSNDLARDASPEMDGYLATRIGSRNRMILTENGLLLYLRLWKEYAKKHDVSRYHEIPALLNEALHQKLTSKVVESCRHLQLEATFKCEVTDNDDQQLMKVHLHCHLCGSRLSFVGLPEEVFSQDKREFRVLFSMTPQQYELKEEEKPSDGNVEHR